ncbi:MAG TPA: hypothetical protein DDW54_00180 [Clostridiales bacterium]|nr:hypothetical protein [Clostridiales bacterium]
MIGWQITEKDKLEKISGNEMLDDIESAKVKITASLLTEEDIAVMSGEDKSVSFPIIPSKTAIGQISELGQQSAYLAKGTRVFLSSVSPCGKCYHCTNGREKDCYSFKIAGYNRDGFLKDFAVKPVKELFALPPSVKDAEAVYLGYISLALSVIDKLNLQKGQHVAIFGADVLGAIIAQLIIYYQGVPILLDDDDEKLLLAKKSGVYYALNTEKKAEKEVLAITGGRLANKVVYISRSKLSTDLAFRLCAPSESIVFVGFSYPNMKVALSSAIAKNLSVICVTNGYGNVEPAINILANNALDLSNYYLVPTKMDDIEKNVGEMLKDYKAKKKVGNLLVNMLG